MRVWSKMALALAAGAWIVPASPCFSQDKTPAPAPKAEKPADDAKKPVGEKAEQADVRPKSPSIELRLVIGGLGSGGCDVEVKPGNAACRFKSQTRHVASDGKLTLVFRDVEVRSVDRNCTFAITMRESGQEPKTVHRGFRMVAPSADGPRAGAQSFTCFMSSPSKVAGLEREGRTIR
ncbi:hypothetical protein [Paludisphaera borealis]|uniref:Uncharacterized protein n=1 Tax=Paludisphaera borealis TaxID=1387353 RepID=A0A1U7CPY2_9BACT|nr:hypothetical protein [Paludisphaera borealis]APW60987.1 hypothetical protein BSF38_02485 [Paludisphaera borealis]